MASRGVLFEDGAWWASVNDPEKPAGLFASRELAWEWLELQEWRHG